MILFHLLALPKTDLLCRSAELIPKHNRDQAITTRNQSFPCQLRISRMSGMLVGIPDAANSVRRRSIYDLGRVRNRRPACGI
jgi:hypothetical protein